MEQNNIISDVGRIQNLSVNIFQTNNWLLDKYKIILGKHNLKYNEYFVLKELSKSYPKPIPMYSIHHSIIDKNMNLSRVIDGLFNDKLVNRTQSKDDRRVVDVLLTKKGLNVLNEIENNIEILENSSKEFDERDAEVLNKLLIKFRESRNMNFNFDK